MTFSTRIRSSLQYGTALLGCLMFDGCRDSGTDRPTVDAWLTCIECIDDELDSLKALAVRRPGTVDTLLTDLVDGPSSARRGMLTQQLQTTYQEMMARLASDPSAGPLTLTQSEFVDLYLGNMVAIYQGRAARGLGEIGGVSATKALDSALSLPASTFDSTVVARIKFARDSIIGP